MVVIYYTSANFLDEVVETIQCIKDHVTLHLVIEISDLSKHSSILSIDNISEMNEIETAEKIMGSSQWNLLKHYFEGVATVEFSVHKNKRSFSLSTLQQAYRLGKYLKKYKADIVHFDNISPRAIGLVPYLKSKKLLIAVHDPKQHSGESDWRDHLPNYIFYKISKGYFFYSNFAYLQFIDNYKKIKANKYVIKLQPYTSFSLFSKKQTVSQDYILFFGRLSYYKGIDLLLDAIPKVLEKYPDQKFMIAGNPGFGYTIDEEIISKYKNNIQIKTGFIGTHELVALIENSKFVVCPYRDATQSGVIMTAFAMEKMVVATDVGSFCEYVKEGVNGLLCNPDADDIANKISEALHEDLYKKIELTVNDKFSKETGYKNQLCILDAYDNSKN